MLGNDFWYKTIKRYFELGCYSKEDVQKYYSPLNKITEEQCKEIIGEPKEQEESKTIVEENPEEQLTTTE
ncbi:XkdX family protein [Bacillus mycoides]|uniref:XkdX family protein n=1 Tax=Bacillus mycoides TaxID=1405 RepID=UPI0025A0B233|nr:XkdX family protein [Bacillus mycoides]MDM5430242.1 XkdX family protein [Bacillus mycoides]